MMDFVLAQENSEWLALHTARSGRPPPFFPPLPMEEKRLVCKNKSRTCNSPTTVCSLARGVWMDVEKRKDRPSLKSSVPQSCVKGCQTVLLWTSRASLDDLLGRHHGAQVMYVQGPVG